MNRAEERLTAALRGLAGASRQSASPELAVALKDAFHHHHARRRRIRRIRITVCVFFLAALAAIPLLKKSPAIGGGQHVAVRTIPPEEVTFPTDTGASTTRPLAIKSTVSHTVTASTMAGFVPLPAFDMLPAGDELSVVRLELPLKSLRLVGVPVDEEASGRRVQADFVVGPDRTPYAVRLVSYPVLKGE